MRILVTGAGGFVGQHMASALADCGHHVIAHYRRPPVPRDDRFEIVVHDLCRPGLPVTGRIDLMIHTAAAAAADQEKGGGDPDRYLADNIIATQMLARWACEGDIGGVLFLSSLSVYGSITVPVVEPMTRFQQPGLYGASKLFAERVLAAVVASGGPPVVAARLPGVIGPGAPRNWLTGTLAKLKSGRDIQIFNADADFNNAVHVADLAAWAGQLAGRSLDGFRALTLGAASPLTIRQIVRHMHAAVGAQSAIETVPAAQHSFYISIAEAVADFGYQPMTMAAMLARFVAENEGVALSKEQP